MPAVQTIYCKSGIFTCYCCAYSTTIYSDTEWLKFTIDPTCNKCHGNCNNNYNQGIIYRNDIDKTIPLHMQLACMPVGINCCENCTGYNEKMHWTKLEVRCHNCKKNTLLFTEYIAGKNILQFYEQCVDFAKPSHPRMRWINKIGDSIFVISGPGEGFSST